MTDQQPDLGGKNADAILDDGIPGLQYFAQLVDRYKKAFGDAPKYSLNDIYAKYDEQRGLNLAKLADAATGLRSALKDADEQWDTQKALVNRLPTLWQGQASSAAQHMFGQQLDMADVDRAKVRAAMKAIETAIPQLRKDVQDKSDHVRKLVNNAGDVKVGEKTSDGGKSPADIDVIIAGKDAGTTNVWSDTSLGSRITKIFPDLGESFGSGWDQVRSGMPFTDGVIIGGSPYAHRIQSRCRGWLNAVFKHEFDDALNNYVQRCTDTDSSIKTHYGVLVKAMQDLDGMPYPRPKGADETTTAPTNPTSPTPTAPTGTTPTPTTTTPTTTTPTTTTTTTPATTTTTSALQGLASLTSAASQLSSLGTTISQGLSSLGTSIKDGVDNAIEQLEKTLNPTTSEDQDGDGKSDGDKDKTVAEFDLGGKHMKVEIGADGQPKLVMTDADGKTHEYGVKLDENGNPTISTDEPKAADGKSGDNPEPQTSSEKPDERTPVPDENTSGSPATVPGVPSGSKREEDGEHTPQPMPEAGNPDETADSGAKLAEAGPL